MEHTIELSPLEGVMIDDKMIPLGCGREYVLSMLGEGLPQRNSLYYFDNELRLDFSDKGRLEFVECLGGMDGKTQPTLYFQEVFQLEADKLLAMLKNHNGPDILEEEGGCSYAFRAISVGLYREITPAALDEMMKQMINVDLTALGEYNLAEEQRKANHWATVGIGVHNYYRR